MSDLQGLAFQFSIKGITGGIDGLQVKSRTVIVQETHHGASMPSTGETPAPKNVSGYTIQKFSESCSSGFLRGCHFMEVLIELQVIADQFILHPSSLPIVFHCNTKSPPEHTQIFLKQRADIVL